MPQLKETQQGSYSKSLIATLAAACSPSSESIMVHQNHDANPAPTFAGSSCPSTLSFWALPSFLPGEKLGPLGKA